MPTGCCLPPCMTVCWPTRSWQSWRAAPTRRSSPRASSPKPLTPPHRTAILKRRTPSLPCLRIPASTRLLCQLWQSGCMENSAKSKTVFLFICLKQPASTGCSSKVWVLFLGHCGGEVDALRLPAGAEADKKGAQPYPSVDDSSAGGIHGGEYAYQRAGTGAVRCPHQRRCAPTASWKCSLTSISTTPAWSIFTLTPKK